MEDIGSHLVLALEAAYRVIRQRHPEVPTAAIVIAPSESRYGHFAPCRWKTRTSGDLAEIMVSGESLKRSAREVLGTLIHEAAHGVAYTRGISDVSRDGKYHNNRFKQIAEELGLRVDKAEGKQATYLGHTNTELPEGEYDDVVADLEVRLVAYREFDQQVVRLSDRSRSISVRCRCRVVQASRKSLDIGPILCGVCEDVFE